MSLTRHCIILYSYSISQSVFVLFSRCLKFPGAQSLHPPTILNVLNENEIHAIAHITGGGLPENVARILGEAFDAVIHKSSWKTPRIFSEIQSAGAIDDEEMFRVFNFDQLVFPSIQSGFRVFYFLFRQLVTLLKSPGVLWGRRLGLDCSA